MESKTQQVFDALRNDSDNQKCFECNREGAQWASVNNGIFICLNCSGKHRGFGVDLSFVRSVTMDNWYYKHI